MGYSTDFTLKWKPRDNYEAKDSCDHIKVPGMKFCPTCGIEVGKVPLHAVIAKYIEARKETFGVAPDGSQTDPCKWYECMDDMKEMSSEIRNVLFTLHGEGEDSGDIWDAYFLNGKCQKEKAVLTIQPFDEGRLT